MRLAAGKSAVVLGSFEGKEGSAIIAVEKKPFDPQLLPGVRLNPKPYTPHPKSDNGLGDDRGREESL